MLTIKITEKASSEASFSSKSFFAAVEAAIKEKKSAVELTAPGYFIRFITEGAAPLLALLGNKELSIVINRSPEKMSRKELLAYIAASAAPAAPAVPKNKKS